MTQAAGRAAEALDQRRAGMDVRLAALADAYRAVEAGPGQKAAKFCDAFVKTIETGYWRPGDLLPTEVEVAAALPISLGTVRVALRQLAAEGIVKRTRRLGTTISTPPDPAQDPKHIRYLDARTGNILPHETQVVSVEETAEQGPWSAYLGARGSYIRIVRHMAVAGEFTVFNEFFLESPKFRPFLDIAPETLERLHLRLILHDRFNSPTLGFDQNIGYIATTPETAAVIGGPAGVRVLVHEILSYSLRERPLSYQRMIIPPNDRMLNLSYSP